MVLLLFRQERWRWRTRCSTTPTFTCRDSTSKHGPSHDSHFKCNTCGCCSLNLLTYTRSTCAAIHGQVHVESRTDREVLYKEAEGGTHGNVRFMFEARLNVSLVLCCLVLLLFLFQFRCESEWVGSGTKRVDGMNVLIKRSGVHCILLLTPLGYSITHELISDCPSLFFSKCSCVSWVLTDIFGFIMRFGFDFKM